MINEIYKKRKKGRFFTLLVLNYVVFTLILVIFLSGILRLGMYMTTRKIMETFPEQIPRYKKILSEGKYKELPLKKIVGEGGYIIVLDGNLNEVYKSNPNVPIPNFSKEELELIPNQIMDSYIIREEFTNEKNEKCTSVWINYKDKNNEFVERLYVFDQNRNILYQSIDDGRTSLTDRQYEILTDTLYDKYKISKHIFKNNLGTEYIMLLYQLRENEEVLYSKIDKITIEMVIGFLVFYFVLIIAFIIWLNRKVKKPLNLLQDAMEKFSQGKRENYLYYKGPREFVQICESFNNMSMELYESEENRKKLEQDKQKMLADISHDLKTPITVIQGYAKLVCDGIVKPEEEKQYLETIYKKAEGLTDLINSFYEYSKMEHPDYSLNLEQVDVVNFLRDYMADKYTELELVGFNLDVDIPEKHINCNIDKVQLKRAIENIISNSVKHNKIGTTITCILEVINDKVKIMLADNGCGIPIDMVNDIFEPFVVGEKSRSKQGSGLGLAVSKKIIEAHGGRISLINPPHHDYKTEIEIILPI